MWTIGLDAHQRLFVVCILDSSGRRIKTERLRGGPEVLWAYLRKLPEPFQICYEASCGYGYLYDRLVGLARRVLVAHPGGVRLIFRAKRKHDRSARAALADRIDARKLATLLFLEQVPTVYVPASAVRSWRRLIQFRRRLVAQRTAVKNRLRSSHGRLALPGRALLRAHGLTAPRRGALWTRRGQAWLAAVEWPTREAALERDLGLDELEHLNARLRTVERQLNALGRRDPRITLLRTIPGVGPRTAEALVAWIDDVRRFRHNRQVGCYFGLVPSQDQSAGTNRLGHITREGPSVVRQLLCEAAWQAKGRSPFLRAYFERIRHGDPDRAKIALIALARYLACVAAAMLRSGEAWRHDPPVPAVAGVAPAEAAGATAGTAATSAA
jgi:transposase